MTLLSATDSISNVIASELRSTGMAEQLLEKLTSSGIALGKRLLLAVIVFIVGRFLIKLANKLVARFFEKQNIDESIETFLASFINITMMIILVVCIIGTLGVETTSLAALMASAGVAIGMALSGNLSNFAGGIVVLFIKPYKIGDVIETQNEIGTVSEIQIFHTVLTTFDNKVIFIPNGLLSSGVVTNYSYRKLRRIDFICGVEYGESFERVRAVLERISREDDRILDTPAPQIVVNELAASSVNVLLRVWVSSEDYWDVNFDTNQTIYDKFNAEGIGFAFPQLTIHQAK